MNWDQYFLHIAVATSMRSKDPSTKVGAIIVDSNRHQIASGYNGMPAGMDESGLWADRETKYKYVVHAEENALLHSVASVRGGTLYSTLEPCGKCMRLLAAAGIAKVVCLEGRYDIVGREIAYKANIQFEVFNGN